MVRFRSVLGAGAAVAAAVVLAVGPAGAGGWTVAPVPAPAQPATLYGISADSGSDAGRWRDRQVGFQRRPAGLPLGRQHLAAGDRARQQDRPTGGERGQRVAIVLLALLASGS